MDHTKFDKPNSSPDHVKLGEVYIQEGVSLNPSTGHQMSILVQSYKLSNWLPQNLSLQFEKAFI